MRINDDQARALGIGHMIPRKPARAKGPNRTEARYAGLLDDQVRRGQVRRYWFEAVRFRLADRCWYLPDYLVERPGGALEVHEIKGGWIRDDAKVKLKVAAELMPFRFYLCQWDGRAWTIKQIGGQS